MVFLPVPIPKPKGACQAPPLLTEPNTAKPSLFFLQFSSEGGAGPQSSGQKGPNAAPVPGLQARHPVQLGAILLVLEGHSMSLYCPPAPLIGNLAGTPTESDERSAGDEDGRRFEQTLQNTHHLASAAETKEAGRENTSAISL